jgi:hypothetical protein
MEVVVLTAQCSYVNDSGAVPIDGGMNDGCHANYGRCKPHY